MKIVSKRHEAHPSNAASPVTFAPTSVEDINLPDGLYIRLRALCRSCGNSYMYDGDISDFDFDMSYCGRSFSCIP